MSPRPPLRLYASLARWPHLASFRGKLTAAAALGALAPAAALAAWAAVGGAGARAGALGAVAPVLGGTLAGLAGAWALSRVLAAPVTATAAALRAFRTGYVK